MNKDAQNFEPTYAFSNGEGLLELCKIHQCNISEIMGKLLRFEVTI